MLPTWTASKMCGCAAKCALPGQQHCERIDDDLTHTVISKLGCSSVSIAAQTVRLHRGHLFSQVHGLQLGKKPSHNHRLVCRRKMHS